MQIDDELRRDIVEPTDWAIAIGGTVAVMTVLWFAL